ncbi:hypothetical protein D3C85_1621800 [compost metagenome]
MRVDFLDTVLGDLEQVLAIECGARVGGNIQCSHGCAARRVQGEEFSGGGKPDLFTIPGHAMHIVDAFKRPIFTKDYSS